MIKSNKLFKCSFFTRSFDKDLRSWLRERAISKVNVKERDMYNTAISLSELVTQLRNISVNINPIKREYFVVAMNKIFYVPYIFLADIFQAADIGNKMSERPLIKIPKLESRPTVRIPEGGGMSPTKRLSMAFENERKDKTYIKEVGQMFLRKTSPSHKGNKN